jgi:hypothetical protein
MSGGKWRRLRKEVVGVKEGQTSGHTPLCKSICISRQHKLIFIKTSKHSTLSFHILVELGDHAIEMVNSVTMFQRRSTIVDDD